MLSNVKSKWMIAGGSVLLCIGIILLVIDLMIGGS